MQYVVLDQAVFDRERRQLVKVTRMEGMVMLDEALSVGENLLSEAVNNPQQEEVQAAIQAFKLSTENNKNFPPELTARLNAAGIRWSSSPKLTAKQAAAFASYVKFDKNYVDKVVAEKEARRHEMERQRRILSEVPQEKEQSEEAEGYDEPSTSGRKIQKRKNRLDKKN